MPRTYKPRDWPYKARAARDNAAEEIAAALNNALPLIETPDADGGVFVLILKGAPPTHPKFQVAAGMAPFAVVPAEPFTVRPAASSNPQRPIKPDCDVVMRSLIVERIWVCDRAEFQMRTSSNRPSK